MIDSEGKMKKIIIALMLLALSVGAYSCGGGAGSVDRPKGENPGTPSVVQLSPSQFVAQTNTVIALHAQVLDGNGKPLANRRVIFTNLSPIGVLSSTIAETGGAGIATVTLKSTTEGFATVQAEVNKGVGQVRCRKTVFFSSNSCCQPIPTLTLSVNGPGDPYTLFEPGVANDDEVVVTATVFDGFGRLVSGINVSFGSDSSEATFPLGSLVSTDTNGQASVLVKVVPSELRAIPTVMNITALAYNSAFNMVSLTIDPVTIGNNIQVSANPQAVDSGDTSDITAVVATTAGTPVPDGTTVNFTASQGNIDPFAQTTNGVATATFTAPTVTSNTSATITASAGGIFGSTSVSIKAPVTPPTTDTTSPTVSSTNPAKDATDVSYPTTVTITFSESIDCSTVTSTTITITPSVTWNLTSCTGNQAVFDGDTVGGITTYTVNIGTGVKDLAGNPAVAYVFSFKTGT
jgi:hypothetical protein